VIIAQPAIPFKDVEFLPTSGQDNTGRVFRYKGEIYRGIYKTHSLFYNQLFSGPIGSELQNMGLVPTKVDWRKLENFDLVLKHKTIPFVSYPIEWCSAMLQSAAILVCNLQLQLLPKKMVLKDGHPFNILFYGTIPFFIDIGSIEKFTRERFLFFTNEYIIDFYFTLLLLYAGYRKLLNAFFISQLGLPAKMSRLNYLFIRLLLGTLPLKDWLYHLKGVQSIKRLSNVDPEATLKLLKIHINRIPVLRKGQKKIGHYKQPDLKDKEYHSRNKIIKDIVGEIAPKSAIIFNVIGPTLTERLDLGIDHVIDAATDEDYLNKLFMSHADGHTGKLLPLRVDLCSPTPAQGPWGICNSANERLKSELSVIYNLRPETLKKKRRTLKELFFYLSCFTTRWSIIDFRYSAQLPSYAGSTDQEFTQSNITNTLKSVYGFVKTIPQLNESGWIFLCSKKDTSYPTS
jgi:hypothetical protein